MVEEGGEVYQRYPYKEEANVATSGIRCEPREKMKRTAGSVADGVGWLDLVERAVEARSGASKMERERIVPAVRRELETAKVWARRMAVGVVLVVVVVILLLLVLAVCSASIESFFFAGSHLPSGW